MAAALGNLAGEKQRILSALEADAAGSAKALNLDDPACRLAAAHVLEEAVAADPSEHLADFAAAIAGREITGGEAEAVLPGARLRALAHLVLGNWHLFAGRKDEAMANFRAAWAALGAFDAPAYLCAWVEVGESLRRSYDGLPVVGRLLAERALETFERYGLGRGVLRARHARAVALYTASEFREAQRELRAVLRSKDATGLDRARAVSGAAFCLAARGRFHDAAKEYSPVRRKLKGEGGMVEQYLLQGEMKAALGTAGRWHPRRDGLAAFALPEAAGAFHARDSAAEIVKAVSEEGLERAKELLAKIEADPSRGYAYLNACQLANPKVSGDPAMYVELARAISEATRSLPCLAYKGPTQAVCSEQVLGEAGLLESNALNFLGLAERAQKSASAARNHFLSASEDTFALALANYFDGSAATFRSQSTVAWKSLNGARSDFQHYGQENWKGRAEAAIGVLLFSREKYQSALRFYDGAVRLLDPDLDGTAYTATLVNRANCLIRIGRLEAAKAAYVRCIGPARRLRMSLSLLNIRNGLATIELLNGNTTRALQSFERVLADATERGLEVFVLCAQLRIAQCLSRLGRSDEVARRVSDIRDSVFSEFILFEPAYRELCESVGNQATSPELIAHIADYLDGKNRGVRTPYKPFRLLRKGS
jgi:tetratricopeptide (TPR) repeat protein